MHTELRDFVIPVLVESAQNADTGLTRLAVKSHSLQVSGGRGLDRGA